MSGMQDTDPTPGSVICFNCQEASELCVGLEISNISKDLKTSASVCLDCLQMLAAYLDVDFTKDEEVLFCVSDFGDLKKVNKDRN